VAFFRSVGFKDKHKDQHPTPGLERTLYIYSAKNLRSQGYYVVCLPTKQKKKNSIVKMDEHAYTGFAAERGTNKMRIVQA